MFLIDRCKVLSRENIWALSARLSGVSSPSTKGYILDFDDRLGLPQLRQIQYALAFPSGRTFFCAKLSFVSDVKNGGIWRKSTVYCGLDRPWTNMQVRPRKSLSPPQDTEMPWSHLDACIPCLRCWSDGPPENYKASATALHHLCKSNSSLMITTVPSSSC